MKSHIIIPDTQVKQGVSIDHLKWIGQYIVEKRPDRIIHLGDHWDMPSLSFYDKGKLQYEGRRYQIDIEAGRKGMEALLQPLQQLQKKLEKNKRAIWKPSMHFLIGNHEHRISRLVEDTPILEEQVGLSDLQLESFGWTVVPYLQPVILDGVKYCHFFPRSPNGRVMQNRRGAPSAKAQVQREMCSCTSGHMQGLDFHVYQTGERRFYGLIAGSCYTHDEDYLTPQGTAYWRGIIWKHQVNNGEYDPTFVSLDYLERKYGH